ncbi:hypothetical protein A4244_02975 [Bacillus badius]|nr:hypothetical protein A4244_02975 [Bacillus badius]OCS86053.1 hypothetical protein A6M11_02975 [Bacillus badius]TDW04238.1 hypothetical protein B0G66_103539 [Bacillus badius]
MIPFSNRYVYSWPLFMHPVGWNGRRADSGGICGTGETPQALGRRGGSPPAPRKAKRLEWKATLLSANKERTADTPSQKVYVSVSL